jgi:hypothetical protein
VVAGQEDGEVVVGIVSMAKIVLFCFDLI